MFGDTFHRQTLEWTFQWLLRNTKTMLQVCNVLVWDFRRSPAWLLWFFKGHPPSCCCNWSPVRGCCCSILSASRLWISVCGCGTNRCYGSRIKSAGGKKKKTAKMVAQKGLTENQSHCWCTRYFTSVSWIINGKPLLWSKQQKQWWQMKKTGGENGPFGS